MKKLMMVMSAALLTLGASAASEVVDGVTWQYTISNGEATIESGSYPCVGEMRMPDTLGGCPVTAIGWGAFSGEKNITSVIAPPTVTLIDYAAFWNCSSLSSFIIPSGLKTIGYHAFSNTSLVEFIMPDSVTALGYSGTFQGCNKLTKVRLSSALREIPTATFGDCGKLESIELPDLIEKIGDMAFENCVGLRFVRIPAKVSVIGTDVFKRCFSLWSITVSDENENFKGVNDCLVSSDGRRLLAVSLGRESVCVPYGVVAILDGTFEDDKMMNVITIPSSVTSIGSSAFYGCSGLKSVEFLGAPPKGVVDSYLLNYGTASYPREYGSEWQKLINADRFVGYARANKLKIAIVSTTIRTDDPTVMDVVFKVTSAKPMVKVRALAFQDGERSFAKVVRPTEFIENTATNIGDEITANEEHKLSWRASADWKTDLAKVKFEVLAVEDDLLPLELTTIPKVGEHAAMEISWNAMTEQQVLDAMFWMYADKDERLTVTDGKVYYDGNLAVEGTTMFANKSPGSYYSRTKNPDTGKYDYVYYTNAIECVYSRMGFGTLSGDELKYANEMTRLGLSPSGVRQYAWREVND